jgi:hypothetical protein
MLSTSQVAQNSSLAVSSTVRASGQLFTFDSSYPYVVVANSGTATLEVRTSAGDQPCGTVPGGATQVVPLLNGQVHLTSLSHGTAVGVTPATLLTSTDVKAHDSNAAALQYFRSQLARRESQAVDIVFIGHSLKEGEGATSVTKRGLDRFKERLRAIYQPSGVAGGYGYIAVRTLATTWDLSSYITVSGGSFSGLYGLGKHSRFVNASGAKVILSSITCTAVDVVYVQGGGGTFSTKVDGVANGDSKATTGSPTALKLYRVPGISGAAASHSVEVDFVSGNSIICGFMVYNGDESAGLRFWTDSQGGILSSQIIDSTNVNMAALDVIPNLALVVISCFANDYKTSVDPAVSKTQLQSIVSNIRAKAPNASIVFEVEHALGNTSAAYPWSSYVQAYYSVAAADGNIAVFDFSQRLGAGVPPTLPGIIYTDSQHYTDSGYLMEADALCEFVRP